jgi:hypothetical protein
MSSRRTRTTLAQCRHHVLGEEVLRLDGFPVLDAAKIADDDHLIEPANLLVQPPDLRDHLRRGPQETQLFLDALVT